MRKEERAFPVANGMGSHSTYELLHSESNEDMEDREMGLPFDSISRRNGATTSSVDH